MNQKIRILEHLIQQTVRKIKKLTEETLRLQKELEAIRYENQKVQQSLRNLETISTKHEKLKFRLTRLYDKLEKLN